MSLKFLLLTVHDEDVNSLSFFILYAFGCFETAFENLKCNNYILKDWQKCLCIKRFGSKFPIPW